MSPINPLSAFHVIPVRYNSDRYAEDDERGVDAYAESGVYNSIGAAVTVIEPAFPEDKRSEIQSFNLGLLNSEIADAVAAARRKGEPVLMTGGNCTHITGVFGGLQDVHGPAVRAGLIWFDAHGDFNTPQTTLTNFLGGMPVAVCAGLAFPDWRAGSHIVAPVPTDRIVMVDVRNLDPAEAELIHAVGIPVVPVTPVDAGSAFHTAVTDLADRCDLLYLHIDADILDEWYVPDHGTREPNGPDMATVLAAIDAVMATGKVAVYAVVSVYAGGPGRARSVETGIELIRSGLAAWKRSGAPLF